ncbi:hypothetical protein V8953_14135 [Klebsiella michiganensis]|uniref:hypothetical protein n=1 Tax=Klebsiella michiganensis TaxID=1134687 RepID=UPI0030D115F0
MRLFLHFCQSNKSILVAHYLLLSLFKREGLTTLKRDITPGMEDMTGVYLADEEGVPRRLKRKTGHIP